ncbi:MAG: MG2 domain-containing protein [Steroidobacteraceae bacterium]
MNNDTGALSFGQTVLRAAPLTLVLALALLAAGCQRSKDPPSAAAPTAAAADPAWSAIVSAHTTGAVSRKSSLRVLFVNDVIPAAKVGSDAGNTLTLQPTVAGRATFASQREILFVPTNELAPATTYLARLRGDGLTGVPAGIGPFEFIVQTMQPNFDVAVERLDIEDAGAGTMRLTGTIATADHEDPALIEKVLAATVGDAPVVIEWQHAPASRRHAFTIAGLAREQAAQTLTLRWDGQPIGAAAADTREIDIPARDQFSVTQAQALEQDGRRVVVTQFSDHLDAKQNLKGLVRLSSGAFTSRVEGNTLTLYPDENAAGTVTLSLEAGIRNKRGDLLQGQTDFSLEFTTNKPQVRFVGRGVILPDASTLSVPFEAVSARAVRVTALRIYESNVPQFLQVNSLDGANELGRVGRFLWQKVIPLTAPVAGRWTRYNLDVTELMQSDPGGIFQLTLSIAPPDSTYSCPGITVGTATPATADLANADPANQEDGDTGEPSNWDYAEEYFGADVEADWRQRDNPCNPAYYRYSSGVRAARNLLASNIGLLAKRDQRGAWLTVATNLRDASPLAGAEITAQNFQGRALQTATTDSAGIAEFPVIDQPFMLVARHKNDKAYLKVNNGVQLPVSHFDAGGETVSKGLKGYLYGDRGVWRPGDAIHLTFVVQDKGKTLPANHPVTLELRNPRGQLVQTLTNATPVGQFYRFELTTAADAPTGDWTARALLGGTTFTKTLKIETIMPNRLKIDLELGDATLVAGKPLAGKLSSQWLSGATAAGLKADIEVRLTPTTTRFSRFTDYQFDDPARSFSGDPQKLFTGALDDNGTARIDGTLDLPNDAPGMLNASFATRVFERGGAFSINRATRSVAPFERFVGLRLPKGDSTRDMLMTDKNHVVEIASLSAAGEPVDLDNIQVTLEQIEWRWWWDQSGETLAQYTQRESRQIVKQETIATRKGQGQWTFQIKYPQWGRYLLRACDLNGGHCTGRVFYIDWPSWAGKARDQAGPAANILTITADKEEYKVGETATIQLPEAADGRALVTLETGAAILEHRWVEPRAGANRITIPITGRMAPNVYVGVTMIQPHEHKGSDRPIRLYGLIPLKVTDPTTRLAPAIKTADEWVPQTRTRVQVSETSGRAMTYTLAIVDEGLLGLTNFRTPNLHGEFYKREALGIATWDLFDDVVGSYGAQLERLLALGGSDEGPAIDPNANKSRFPPVVRFMGPFQLAAKATASHEVELPQYIGAVRIMLVAGDGSAYGSADKSVFVRQPLMILPTLPRVIGPEESVSLPVSIFVSEPSIKNATLRVETDALLTAPGDKSVSIAFARPEEKLGMLHLQAGRRLGRSHIRVLATSGKHTAASDIYLEVRSPNPSTTKVQRAIIEPGERWQAAAKWHGLAGTNDAVLEVSAVPPLNLDGQLDYLIHYPHGCLEQITSGAFPQVFLPTLIALEPERRAAVERNVEVAIERLRGFQQANGGFAYWPGGFTAAADLRWRDDWSTTYAGHFLVEAEKAGYRMPPELLTSWIRYQTDMAQRWSTTDNRRLAARSAGMAEAERLAQAYRLYTLARAGKPEIGAMNRLRESPSMSTAERWMLAAAYQLAGLGDAAAQLVRGQTIEISSNDADTYSFGSAMRDRAIVLQALVLLGRSAEARTLVDAISAELVSGRWHSTQSVAYALLAIGQYAGGKPFEAFTYELSAPGRTGAIKAEKMVSSTRLDPQADGAQPVLVTNTADRPLYATLIVRGVPASGSEDAAQQGLSIRQEYADAGGTPGLAITRIEQGTDLMTRVTVSNTSRRRLDNLALTQMLPAGWEIRNERLEGAAMAGDRDASESSNRGWFIDGSPDATNARAEYVDIRDDRILRYFSLQPGESVSFVTRVNAAYLGRYYLPSVSVAAMYDATQFARTRGQWVEVVSPAR